MIGQRIVVTGGASGIGRATAALAQSRGAQVALLDRRHDSASPSKALCRTVDVTDPSALDRAFADVSDSWGAPPTGVIHAAGVYRIRESAALTLSEWNEVLAVNLTGTLLVAQTAMRALTDGGAIVLLSSIAAERGDRSEPAAHYAASKGGVSALCRQLAVEWGPLGIRVNAVAPGVIDTPMLRLGDDPERMEGYLAGSVPLGRLGRADEVAEACLFLSGPGATYISGAVLAVDGGAGAA